jgi:methyltransferase (TIGR00027 family)
MRPQNERICHDPYALYFLPDHLLTEKNIKIRIQQTVSDWETRFPGVGHAIIARTRFIDDCLKEAIDAGIRQLVILGAGYDTRALRFKELKDEVTVFELDHPATQRMKLERIKHHVKEDVSHVRFLSIDFSEEEFDSKLLANGYDMALHTFFILEGVTYYLPESAIDRTLLFIANRSPKKSAVAFDYFPPSVADGTITLAEARALRKGLKNIGEEIVFGIEPEKAADFMKARGLRLIINLSTIDYRNVYFKEIKHTRKVSGMFLFSLAEVA